MASGMCDGQVRSCDAECALMREPGALSCLELLAAITELRNVAVIVGLIIMKKTVDSPEGVFVKR